MYSPYALTARRGGARGPHRDDDGDAAHDDALHRARAPAVAGRPQAEDGVGHGVQVVGVRVRRLREAPVELLLARLVQVEQRLPDAEAVVRRPAARQLLRATSASGTRQRSIPLFRSVPRLYGPQFLTARRTSIVTHPVRAGGPAVRVGVRTWRRPEEPEK